jgi:hypothetical protein
MLRIIRHEHHVEQLGQAPSAGELLRLRADPCNFLVTQAERLGAQDVM